MNDMDSLLFDTLSPQMKPDDEINQRIIGIGKESKVMAYKNAKENFIKQMAVVEYDKGNITKE